MGWLPRRVVCQSVRRGVETVSVMGGSVPGATDGQSAPGRGREPARPGPASVHGESGSPTSTDAPSGRRLSITFRISDGSYGTRFPVLRSARGSVRARPHPHGTRPRTERSGGIPMPATEFARALAAVGVAALLPLAFATDAHAATYIGTYELYSTTT
ncbi:hypothetical protein GCM10009759_64820 [Kitasatospora saccharophila]|uniref:Uncharacterized protein n=1 Tax=Kitasatospora saccharophila TaxID=407973 RepID=A0ABP5JJ68_9ACTN